MTAPLLETRGLSKSYGDREVVSQLELICNAGSVLGLLGPNGAGKTTTLRMLYGFIEPDAGEIRYRGRDFAEERTALKRIIGVCTQEDTLDYDFSVEQNLQVYAGYFNPRVPNVKQRVQELLEQFDLTQYRDASPHALSGGYKQRLLIARSIVHHPEILFLDEPTTGLDPAARVAVWELVDQLRKAGMGVILTTHYMDEAERLSDQLVVLREGRVAARGLPHEVLGSLLGEHVLTLRADLEERPQVLEVLREMGLPTHKVLSDILAPVTARQLADISERLPSVRLTVRPPNLDDLFLELSRSSSRGAKK
ncbi:MAG: ABC transporter ATP-binding protein [Polyangiaceae bacterium]